MTRRTLALLLVLVAPAAVAQAGDPLQSPGCRRALDALASQEARSDAASRDSTPRETAVAALRTARRDAALACLGSRADAPPAQHLAQPPVRVAPVVIPTPASMPRATAPIEAPPRPAPPVTVMSCDPAGCWASDGTRLQRNGPDLVGPRGLCTVVGGALRCP